jgi:hypothetical protein
MESLKEKGIEIYAAYGNTPTDIKAYEAAGVPKVGAALHSGRSSIDASKTSKGSWAA